MSIHSAAIIPVAGLSSRMGSFKPLLLLDGKPMIARTVQNCLDAGIELVCVVTGHHASEVVEALVSLPSLLLTHNEAYATSDMFQSIKLGLDTITACDSEPEVLFVIPGDIPCVDPATFTLLEETWRQTAAPLLVPGYEGKRGHPLLIDRQCFATLRTFTGEGGLRKALEGFTWSTVAVADRGILLDADTPQAFTALEAYQQTLDTK